MWWVWPLTVFASVNSIGFWIALGINSFRAEMRGTID